MPKTKAQKAEIVDELADKLEKARIIVFSSFSKRGKKGLDVKAMLNFKKQLRDIRAEYVVAKKTLARLALKKASKDKVDVEDFEGSLGILIGYEDLIEPAKSLYKLSKENESISIYSGLMDGTLLSNSEVMELANLPPKEVLISRFSGVIRFPLSGLVNVLQANLRNLVFVLNQKVAKSG